MKNPVFIILFLFIFLSSSCLYAEEDFSLNEALGYASLHSPSIIISKNKVKKAELSLKQARQRLDTSLSFHFGYSPLLGKEAVAFSVSQDLARLLGANKKEKAQAALELNCAEQELIIAKQQLELSVTRAFNNLQLQKRGLKLKEAEYLDAKLSSELADEKFSLGEISMDELLAKQQAARSSGLELTQAEQDTQEAYLVFYQAIGYQVK